MKAYKINIEVDTEKNDRKKKTYQEQTLSIERLSHNIHLTTVAYLLHNISINEVQSSVSVGNPDIIALSTR